MRIATLGKISTVLSLSLLSGCVTTQAQPDGSTKVNVSLKGIVPDSMLRQQPTAEPAQALQPAAKAQPVAPANLAPGIRSTALAGIFKKHPYDGTPKSYFPKVAVTVIDWSRNDCWTAAATIWWNKTKSERTAPFSVCPGQSLGFSVNNAANLHLFMGQTAVEHSGNVRTSGPKPPLIAIPDRQPIAEQQQLAFNGFIQQLILETGWGPGAPTNMWLVGYDANARSSSKTDTGAAASPVAAMNANTKMLLERALSCQNIGKFDAAEAELKRNGWTSDAGVTPVALAQPLKVFGLNTSKIAVKRDGFEHLYRAHLPGVSLQQAVKAASLKLGKDKQSYGRIAKLGVLSADVEAGETILTCTVDTEG